MILKTIFLLLCLALASSAPSDDFSVGSITASPGTSATGFLEIPAGVDEGTKIPVTVIRGSSPGPTLALIAGTHGYEYAPIIAMQHFRSQLDPKQIKGTVILVQVANMPSFLKRTIYYSPVDGKNLNRMYPGKPEGTVSERIAHTITKEIIDRCDYLVDLHCGDGNESLRPYTYWQKSGNDELDEKSKQMALAFGLDHIVIDAERPKDPAQSIYCSNTATTRGKPALTIESGARGQTDESSVRRVEKGCMNLMRFLKMIQGDAEMVRYPIWIDRNEVLRSTVTGIFYPLVERDKTVSEGTLLGYVTDFFGQKTMEVKAPFEGIVLYILGTPPVNEGEPLAFVGHIQK